MAARVWLLALLVLAGSASFVKAQDRGEGLNLALPTENDALYSGGGPEFYQHIVRDFKGVISRPWQGGQYGFVRNPQETAAGLVYTRFHEGLDIRPVRRAADGTPLDEVRAIAEGNVVHVNLVPGYSNYGKYVVVEHRWDGSPYYSLYGHLASVAVQVGNKVDRGEQLGILGFTGDGLDQSRAHVHLELNLMLNRNFNSWHAEFFRGEPNRNGIYNGINLTGLDLARLYLALRKRPSLTIPEFLAEEEIFYRVTLPAAQNFELPKRYPWLLRGAPAESAASWEVSFNGAGIPLRITPTQEAVTAPVVSYVKKRSGDYRDFTRGIIGGTAENPRLTDSGHRLMRLLIWPD
jgi:murein DD-endopeptidase MepM/ murein hydrolase activator NlpD